MPKDTDKKAVERLLRTYGGTPIVRIRPTGDDVETRGETPIMKIRPPKAK